MSAPLARIVRRLRSASRRRALRRALLRGYTVVEVMMAMAVLSIGATGVIAMQKTALLGNLRARNLATASAIASAWIERLRIDGVRWTLNDAGIDTIATATAYLNVVGNDYPTVSGLEGQWFIPGANPDTALAGVQPTEDVRGMDTVVATEQGFCTHVRLTQVLRNMIRAEVRVFWLRRHGGGEDGANTGTIGGTVFCSPAEAAQFVPATPGGPLPATVLGRYHFVHLSSTILRNDD